MMITVLLIAIYVLLDLTLTELFSVEIRTNLTLLMYRGDLRIK